MRFLATLGIPLPHVFHTTAEFVLNNQLRRVFKDENLDLQRICALLDAARSEKISLDEAGLGYALEQTIGRLMEQLRADPSNLPLLQKLEAVAELVRTLPFTVNLWKAQKVYYQVLQTTCPELRGRAARDREAQAWVSHFTSLGEKLYVRVPSH